MMNEEVFEELSIEQMEELHERGILKYIYDNMQID